MKYRYRNSKTGETITTSNRIGGKNWVPVEEPKQPPVEGKLPHVEESPVDDSVMEEDSIEETPEEETVKGKAPAEKQKSTRRGKK